MDIFLQSLERLQAHRRWRVLRQLCFGEAEPAQGAAATGGHVGTKPRSLRSALQAEKSFRNLLEISKIPLKFLQKLFIMAFQRPKRCPKLL